MLTMSGVHLPRLDIQGLRAIAVLLVVFFHAQIAGVEGGFVGVDVFFVISGYVIAHMLRRECEATGTVNLRRFYERRVRRLLPPLAVLVVAVLPVLAVATSPFGPMGWSARTALAAAGFVSNIYLWHTGGGYFDPGDERNAFLHTWSLAVEEQFYLLVPVLLLGCVMLARRAGLTTWRPLAAGVIGVLGVASFVIGLLLLEPTAADRFQAHELDWLTSPDRLAFYGLPARFWELGTGVFCALLAGPSASTRRGAGVVGVVGVILILLPSFTYTERTPFPGVNAVLPVLGAALVLVSPGRLVTRCLSLKPMVWLGDLSYSWYLWHWPMIVVCREAMHEREGLLALAAGLALLPAWLSKRFIEDPIRSNDRIVGVKALALAVTCVVVPGAIAWKISEASESSWGLTMPPAWRDARVAVARGCTDHGPRLNRKRCIFRSARANDRGRVLLSGDSHAASLGYGVIKAAHALDAQVAIIATSNCPAVLGHEPLNKRCAPQQAGYLQAVDDFDADVVVLASRSPIYTLPAVPRESTLQTIGGRHGEVPKDQAEALRFWQDGMRLMLTALREKGVKVIWVSVVPEFPTRFDRFLTLLDPTATPPPVPLSFVQARRGPVLAAEAEVIRDFLDIVTVIDPAAALCTRGPDGICPSSHLGKWSYMDEHHLTPHGSGMLIPMLRTALNRALPPKSSPPSRP